MQYTNISFPCANYTFMHWSCDWVW